VREGDHLSIVNLETASLLGAENGVRRGALRQAPELFEKLKQDSARRMTCRFEPASSAGVSPSAHLANFWTSADELA
jgi:hypothetical protein